MTTPPENSNTNGRRNRSRTPSEVRQPLTEFELRGAAIGAFYRETPSSTDLHISQIMRAMEGRNVSHHHNRETNEIEVVESAAGSSRISRHPATNTQVRQHMQTRGHTDTNPNTAQSIAFPTTSNIRMPAAQNPVFFSPAVTSSQATASSTRPRPTRTVTARRSRGSSGIGVGPLSPSEMQAISRFPATLTNIFGQDQNTQTSSIRNEEQKAIALALQRYLFSPLEDRTYHIENQSSHPDNVPYQIPQRHSEPALWFPFTPIPGLPTAPIKTQVSTIPTISSTKNPAVPKPQKYSICFWLWVYILLGLCGTLLAKAYDRCYCQ